jgi:nucleoside-diphosphate-sugar epimerase
MEVIGRGFLARHARDHFGSRFPGVRLIAAGVSGVHVDSAAEFTREAELVYDVLRRCRADGGTAVFLSTASVGMYGAPDSPGREDGPVFPVTPYGRHKLGLEAVCRGSGARYLVLRLSHIVGRGQAPHQLLPSLTRQLLDGRVQVHRRASRDLLDVRHLLGALDAMLGRGVHDETVNVVSGTPRPVAAVVDELERRLGTRAERVAVDRPTAPVVASVAKLRDLVPELAELDFGPDYLAGLLDRYLDDLTATATAVRRPVLTPTREPSHEGHHPRGRQRDPAAPGHAVGLQAAPPRLQQADDLLPALGADAGGDHRHPDHLHAARPAAVPPHAR